MSMTAVDVPCDTCPSLRVTISQIALQFLVSTAYTFHADHANSSTERVFIADASLISLKEIHPQ